MAKPEKRPFTVADSIRMTQFGDPLYEDGMDSSGRVAQFSPDGQHFVVVLKKGNLEQNTTEYNLLLYQTAEVFNSPRTDILLSLSSSSNRPAIQRIRWLDNENIAFLGERPGEEQQLFTFNCARRRLRQLTRHVTNLLSFAIDARQERWYFVAEPAVRSVDGNQSRPGGVSPGDYYSLVDLIRNDDKAKTLYRSKELFVQGPGDLQETAIHIKDAIRGEDDLWLSPDGKQLLVQGFVTEVASSWIQYRDRLLQQFIREHPHKKQFLGAVSRFSLIDTATGESTILLDAPLAEPWRPQVAWSPDSKAVIIGATYLPLINASAREREVRTSTRFAVEVNTHNHEVTPVTDRPLHLVQWDSSSSKVVFRSTGGDQTKLISYEQSSGSWKESRNTPSPQNSTNITITLDEDMNNAPRIFAFETSTQRKSLLLDLNPQFANLKFGKVEEIKFGSPLGRQVKAGLNRPPEYTAGSRYPLVIQTHGWNANRFWTDGPWTSTFAAQALANKGFMVLQIEDDPQIGVLGAKYMSSRQESPLQMAIVESAIGYLDQMGLIDLHKLGIVAFSRTSLAVKYTLVHSKYHFGAATIADGSDAGYFLYMAAWNGYPTELQLDMQGLNGGPPFGRVLTSWLENSSDFQLSEIHTPVRLEAYGPNTLLFGWEWFSGLSQLGKPVDLIYIQSGQHELRKPWDRLISQDGNVDWMAFWLKNEEDPDPDKSNQYARWHLLRSSVHSD
jgi:dipeptidyl aminopeptidase/acylaminoacyl peptidase